MYNNKLNGIVLETKLTLTYLLLLEREIKIERGIKRKWERMWDVFIICMVLCSKRRQNNLFDIAISTKGFM